MNQRLPIQLAQETDALMAAKSSDAVQVFYVAGYGKSGSTLLDRLLGQMQGFVSAGELRHIWGRGFCENQLCGCGSRFRECPFWGSVREEAFGSVEQFDAREFIALRDSVVRARDNPALAFPALMSTKYRAKVASFSEVVAKLYRAIRKVSGARIIVDSSKVPHYAFILAGNSAIDLKTIHLVRDSRAVAYSWQRKKLRPEIHWKPAFIPIHGTLKSCAQWFSINLLAELLESRSGRYVFVRYEDLSADPKKMLSMILTGLGEEPADLSFLERGSVELGSAHTVSGNPIRFQQGRLQVKVDKEWESRMKWPEKLMVTSLTWPLLLRYGYKLSM